MASLSRRRRRRQQRRATGRPSQRQTSPEPRLSYGQKPYRAGMAKTGRLTTRRRPTAASAATKLRRRLRRQLSARWPKPHLAVAGPLARGFSFLTGDQRPVQRKTMRCKERPDPNAPRRSGSGGPPAEATRFIPWCNRRK